MKVIIPVIMQVSVSIQSKLYLANTKAFIVQCTILHTLPTKDSNVMSYTSMCNLIDNKFFLNNNTNILIQF